MPTISQLIKNPRSVEKKKSKSRAMEKNPQKEEFVLVFIQLLPKNLTLL